MIFLLNVALFSCPWVYILHLYDFGINLFRLGYHFLLQRHRNQER